MSAGASPLPSSTEAMVPPVAMTRMFFMANLSNPVGTSAARPRCRAGRAAESAFRYCAVCPAGASNSSDASASRSMMGRCCGHTDSHAPQARHVPAAALAACQA